MSIKKLTIGSSLESHANFVVIHPCCTDTETGALRVKEIRAKYLDTLTKILDEFEDYTIDGIRRKLASICCDIQYDIDILMKDGHLR